MPVCQQRENQSHILKKQRGDVNTQIYNKTYN